MNIAKYAMKNRQVIHLFLIIALFGGIFAFNNLGKQEDAPFQVKRAVIVTQYPGATQFEVEELVTEPIEKEIQSMGQVFWIKSESKPGISTIWVEMYPWFQKESLPAIWDELRRKILDVSGQMPVGAGEIQVNDAFGDVFGVYYGLSADEGFEYSELEEYADFLKRELTTVQDVAKIDLYGIQKQVINVEIYHEKLGAAGLNPKQVMATLQAQNKVVASGRLESGKRDLRVETFGTFKSISEIENLLIVGQNKNQLKLKDVADVSRGYFEPATTKFRVNGKPAIGIGISTVDGGNAVVMGDEVRKKLDVVMGSVPVGINLVGLYFQNEVAVKANNDFIINLIISVSIVTIIILLIMGFRAGMLIGSSLIFSILGTLLLMLFMGIDLHRTSLAAIIIAMGMLVDNAIVVTDNAMLLIKKGVKRKEALIRGANVPQWGLFGATIIAILSFLPLQLAPANAAEVIKPLFYVLAVSLLLSWIFALTQTPVYGDMILKESEDSDSATDPFDTKFYRKLKSFYELAVNNKWSFAIGIVVVFMVSLSLFGTLPVSFFPAIDKPMFKIDYWMPRGTSINETERDMIAIEEFLLKRDDVKTVSIAIGSSPLRYYLASTAFSTNANYANLLIESYEQDEIDNIRLDLQKFVKENLVDAKPVFMPFKVSPHPDATLEPTIMGPNIDTLRVIADKIENILLNEPLIENVKSSWGEKTIKVTPQYSQTKGLRAGVTREMVANAIKMLTDGVYVSQYREGNQLMPILIKDKRKETTDYGNLGGITILNQLGESIPIDRVVDGFDVTWENAVIRRYQRERALAVQGEPLYGVESAILEVILMPKLAELDLPEGYEIRWDGMYFEQTLTQTAIMENVPLMIISIFVILMILFNSFKKTIVIMLILPLIMIGVVLGFLVTGLSFNFFALLGVLGLIGMVTKNAIVLMEQVDIEIEENGRDLYDAIVNAALSRTLPVSMAAITTILGMIPLLPDPMFGAMATTIMGGLFVATILTLVILPVIFALFFNIKPKKTIK